MSCSTVEYLIFLVQSKSSDVKEWFDKKTKLPCRQQVFVLLDRHFIESLYILSIGIHHSGE